ncbi:MAG: oligoribonuclease [Wenzhouxiangellaceae bacterium]
MDETRLIWIDLEMTGLDVRRDKIIEIATIVTDSELEEIATGPNIAVRATDDELADMDEWNTRTHTASGLIQRCLESHVDTRSAERQTLDFLSDLVPPGNSPMCGNSICQDRRFLARLMPELEAYFHYRNLDVSTIKELARRWAPEIAEGLVKDTGHEALADIRDSIEELKYYRQFMGALAGPGEKAETPGR